MFLTASDYYYSQTFNQECGQPVQESQNKDGMPPPSKTGKFKKKKVNWFAQVSFKYGLGRDR